MIKGDCAFTFNTYLKEKSTTNKPHNTLQLHTITYNNNNNNKEGKENATKDDEEYLLNVLG